ncbi:MAG: TPM domain-containing protein [Gammaproteobacteria bacterium]|nr:TPM domain-containing protein [Gammaproteobacteria bacterium]MDD9823749.1 TPM domain-containing protein [Gammaproteobacteria bacterium]MDD9863766.1 TPM domain-containing protein [Gammaproteobacteria bacterium]
MNPVAARRAGTICLAVLLGGWLGAVLAPAALAQARGGYPEPGDLYVNDYAGVLKQQEVAAIRKMFQELKSTKGVEAVAVTINSISGYGTGDVAIESFATNLFNTWGIGHKERNDGILILVAIQDRKVRIELGKGYGRAYDSAMKRVIDDIMVPRFKKGDYGRGILEGGRGVIDGTSRSVAGAVQEDLARKQRQNTMWLLGILAVLVACFFAGISCMRSGKKGWGYAFFAAAGALLLFLLFLMSRMARGGGGFGGGSSGGGGASGGW